VVQELVFGLDQTGIAQRRHGAFDRSAADAPGRRDVALADDTPAVGTRVGRQHRQHDGGRAAQPVPDVGVEDELSSPVGIAGITIHDESSVWSRWGSREGPSVVVGFSVGGGGRS
jgi:hypothetical protein